jgi:hypothetical protein
LLSEKRSKHLEEICKTDILILAALPEFRQKKLLSLINQVNVEMTVSRLLGTAKPAPQGTGCARLRFGTGASSPCASGVLCDVCNVYLR